MNMLARVSTLRHDSDRQRLIRETADTEARMKLNLELPEGFTIKIQDESHKRIAWYYTDDDDVVRLTVIDDNTGKRYVSERRLTWLNVFTHWRWYAAANILVQQWTGISIAEAQEQVRQRNSNPRGV